jgi:putative membrane-bound dehydrogenase-like protein
MRSVRRRFIARGILAALVVTVAASAPAAEFRFPSGTITVPDGYTIDVAAAAPLVERPVTIDFDERGRLYVTESSGTNIPVAEQVKNPTHRVFRLEDSDGDGTFDTRTVYAEGLMMPEGSLWYRGSLYVTAPPEIWKFTDADDDGVAESREVWFDAKTLTGCANDLHGPYLGRDGRISWCKGAFAEQTYDLPGRPGWKTRASHIFRARDDASELEPVLTGGMDNPVDVVFTPEGERIMSCTFLVHPGGGERDGLIHALYGGVYGKDHGVLDGHARTGPLLPALAHLGPAAPCGLHRHSGFGHGESLAGNLFTTSFNLRTVFRTELAAAGATFTTTDTPFLQADWVDFHPTDVIEDADGSLLVVDTGGWYKLCCPTSQLEKPAVLGAIYRVRRDGTMPIADPRGLALDWQGMTPAGVAALLADPRPAVVARATDTLARLGAAAVPAVRDVFAASTAPAVRQQAIWTLARIDGAEARSAVRGGLRDPDAGVRQAACHVSGLHRDAVALEVLGSIVVNDPAAVARAAAEALGRLGAAGACEPLLAAATRADRADDRALDHSITYALIETASPAPLRTALEAGSPAAKRAALVALDQMADRLPEPALSRQDVIPLCADGDKSVREAAWWVAAHHPDWSAALADQVPGLLRQMTTADAADRAAIAAVLAPLAANPAVAGAVATAIDDDEAGIRAAALEAMRAAHPQTTPPAWVGVLAHLAASPSDRDSPAAAESGEAIAVLAGLPLSKEARAVFRPLAFQIEAAGTLAPRSILQALGLLGDATGELPDVIVGRLLLIATLGESPVDRNAAATVLASATLPERARLRIGNAFSKLGAQEATLLLPGLVKEGGEPLVRAVEGLGQSDAAGFVRRDLLEAAVKGLPEESAALGAELLAKTEALVASEREAFEKLLASLPEGDPVRGHAVFAGKTGSCTSCHAMAYVGGKIGPDLSHIGAIRTPRDLLEAIVRPSASFVRSYEPSIVVTDDGRSFQGVVREEAGGALAVQTSATVVERVPREIVESIEPGRTSIMPQGYDKLLSTQDLADLVAFLHRAK